PPRPPPPHRGHVPPARQAAASLRGRAPPHRLGAPPLAPLFYRRWLRRPRRAAGSGRTLAPSLAPARPPNTRRVAGALCRIFTHAALQWGQGRPADDEANDPGEAGPGRGR